MVLATEEPSSPVTHAPHILSNRDFPWRGIFILEGDITGLRCCRWLPPTLLLVLNQWAPWHALSRGAGLSAGIRRRTLMPRRTNLLNNGIPRAVRNMIFIGDGPTDVPYFRLVKAQGSLSIIMFKPAGIASIFRRQRERSNGCVKAKSLVHSPYGIHSS